MISCGKADLEVGKTGGRVKDRQNVCAAERYVLVMKGGCDWKARGVCGVRRPLINLYGVSLWAFIIESVTHIWSQALRESGSFHCSENNSFLLMKSCSLLRCTSTWIGKCSKKPTRLLAWE